MHVGVNTDRRLRSVCVIACSRVGGPRICARKARYGRRVRARAARHLPVAGRSGRAAPAPFQMPSPMSPRRPCRLESPP
ncbi:hypothetical protein NDU88_006945 [Pleurodeles waltl]|uniref:Uncharacterized protein n=1 Tax=Pleurodeles waltl TaxID=8319 RepID=A0AAV7SRA8_PLEWA|nr:hypothetical protein NDU88_006945 [Pleurodeles waltl]